MNLAGIEIYNLYWANEFEYEGVAQAQFRGVTGALINFEQAQPTGAKMTLTGAWVKRSVLKQLQTKRHLAGQEHTLTLADGRTFTVIWDRTQQSLEAELIEGTRTQPTDDDIYAITLHLQIIAETTAESGT